MRTLASPREKAEILRRLQRLRPDSARQWGRMSAHQMVCHLSDGFRMATGQKAVSHATGLVPRTLIKWIALYFPARWPEGIRTRPEVDAELGGTPPVDFAADVAQLETLIESVTVEKTRIAWQKRHPIFGRMSEAAWLRWAYLHLDHHLRQFGV